jgi:putative ABC transport system permease protein
MFLRILFKSLKVSKSRVFIAFFSLTIGASIITALLSVYFDISIKVSRELRTYGANFFIGPKISDKQNFIDYHIFEKALEEIPSNSLIGASPYLYGIVRLDLGNAVMAGVDFAGLKKLSPYWQVEGKWISVDFDEKHCMIGESLAKKMELKIGDKVNVIKRETGFQKTLIVRGIAETGQADDERIFVNISLAQQVLGLNGKINHALFSIISQEIDIEGFAARLEKQFTDIDAKPIRKISYSEGKILDKIKSLMALVAIIILTITTLCVMITLMAIVVERTQEIGLMKALGADNKTIMLQFLSEAEILALSGAVVGLVTGFILAQVIGQAIFSTSISFRVVVLPLTLIISMITSLIASVIPIRMAVRVAPANVLKGE